MQGKKIVVVETRRVRIRPRMLVLHLVSRVVCVLDIHGIACVDERSYPGPETGITMVDDVSAQGCQNLRDPVHRHRRLFAWRACFWRV